MKPLNSKWSYIACGVALCLAMLGAFLHSLSGMLFGMLLGVFNYYCAEHLRSHEDDTKTTETKDEE